MIMVDGSVFIVVIGSVDVIIDVVLWGVGNVEIFHFSEWNLSFERSGYRQGASFCIYLTLFSDMTEANTSGYLQYAHNQINYIIFIFKKKITNFTFWKLKDTTWLFPSPASDVLSSGSCYCVPSLWQKWYISWWLTHDYALSQPPPFAYLSYEKPASKFLCS